MINIRVNFDLIGLLDSYRPICFYGGGATVTWHKGIIQYFREPVLCIFQPLTAALRAPLSESLSRLDQHQLWKFAQYFIQELPRQALPIAQDLLDQLLNSSSAINATHGAPDPSAESSVNEMSAWCLDEKGIHENIRNLLVKFCMPTPIVCR